MDGAVGCGLQGMGGAVWPVLHGLQRKIRGERESLVEGLAPSALPEFGISFGLLACSNGGCHHVSNYMSFGAKTCSLLQLQPGRAGGIGRHSYHRFAHLTSTNAQRVYAQHESSKED